MSPGVLGYWDNSGGCVGIAGSLQARRASSNKSKMERLTQRIAASYSLDNPV
jgi:hypothetical protein